MELEKKTLITDIVLYRSISLIFYLTTLNNFVDLKRDDVTKILLIYFVQCQFWTNFTS